MMIYMQVIDSPKKRSDFEILYHEYRHKMYSIAYSILQNEQDAEDAVHHAFVTIAENMKKISSPVCPKTASYIVTIVESKAIDIYRRKNRHPQVPIEQVQGLQVSAPEISDLARCMAQLPARQRQILLLKHHHGYTTREIAKMLSLTQANVAKIEQRGKAKLEQLCKEAGIL